MSARLGLDLTLRWLDPSEITIRQRVRRQFRRLEELADSIEQLGQIHPVVVLRKANVLLAGERRARACALRGRKVLALVVDTVLEALPFLQAEAAENLECDPWTMLERYEFAQRLEQEIEREAAAQRKAEGRIKGGRARGAAASGTAVPEAQPKSDEEGRAATRAAKAAGFGSRKEYERTGVVVRAHEAEPQHEGYASLVEELAKPGAKPSAVAAKLERLREGCDSDSYGTPLWVLEGIRKVEGRRIDLDPCTNKNAIALGFINAAINWTIDDDALAQATWDVRGRNTLVFFNPPYSSPEQLVERLVAEWDAGHLGRAYCLTKLDTSTSWWAALRDRAPIVVLPRKRIAHYVGSKPKKGSDFCSGMPVLARGTRAELIDLWSRLVDAFEGVADVYIDARRLRPGRTTSTATSSPTTRATTSR